MVDDVVEWTPTTEGSFDFTLTAMDEDGRLDDLSKKERSRLDKERKRLDKNLSGIADMGGLPHAVFVVDVESHSERCRFFDQRDAARELRIARV